LLVSKIVSNLINIATNYFLSIKLIFIIIFFSEGFEESRVTLSEHINYCGQISATFFHTLIDPSTEGS